jgi:hypothetical protein
MLYRVFLPVMLATLFFSAATSKATTGFAPGTRVATPDGAGEVSYDGKVRTSVILDASKTVQAYLPSEVKLPPAPTPSPTATPTPSPTPTGTRTFDATYESSIIPPWGGIQDCSPTNVFSRSSTRAFSGTWSARAFVSRTCSFGTQRAEVLNTSGDANRFTQGETAYFSDSAYFPSDFPATQEGHCAFNQFHTQERGMNAKGAAYSTWCRRPAVEPNGVEIQTESGDCAWSTPLVRGQWLHFVVGMKFSTSKIDGRYSLWYGTGSTKPVSYTKVISDCPVAALLSSADYGYFKVGYYRGLNNTASASIWHDDSRVGTSFAAVAQQ